METFNFVPETIIRGTPASPHEFPFQVQIRYRNNYHCGGSIISPLLILTAAHCLTSTRASEYEITAGDHNRLVVEGNEQTRSVSKILNHENYLSNGSATYNDIGLMLLSSPLIFNSYVNKVNYRKTPETYSGKATVSGWGRISTETSANPILLKTKIPLVFMEECKRLRPHLTSNRICAGEAGRDACKGDSGGPLTADLTNGGFNVIGLVSFGQVCAPTHELPGVYTNISKYATWIAQAIRKLMQGKGGGSVGQCSSEDYFCTATKKCIKSQYICDGDNDCGDNEDEKAEKCACQKDKWRCPGKNGKCISKAWMCDGDKDCPLGEDEKKCKNTKG